MKDKSLLKILIGLVAGWLLLKKRKKISNWIGALMMAFIILMCFQLYYSGFLQ